MPVSLALAVEHHLYPCSGKGEGEEGRPGLGLGVRLRRARYVWTTYSYLISLEAARRLLGGIVPVDKPIDHHYVLAAECEAVDAFACEPRLVDLAPHYTDSTIGGWVAD